MMGTHRPVHQSCIIERHALMGRGIGYIDAHLLAAVSLHAGTQLWTRDHRLLAVARAMKLSYRNDESLPARR